MDQFIKKFYEEALDLIQELEKSLLILEDDPSNKSHIEQVFRAMHTIKGNSAMFGFVHIDKFTHNLETVYDLVRLGKIKISASLLTITLSAVDHIKRLLNEGEHVEQDTLAASDSLTVQINKFIPVESNSNNIADNVTAMSEAESVTENINQTTYLVSFKPHADIFKFGTNPLFLVDELCALGMHISFPAIINIPEIAFLQTDTCYTEWNIFIASSEDINSIHDIFIFVEDDCELEILPIADYNLLGKEQFINIISELYAANNTFDISELRNYAQTLSSAEVLRGDKQIAKRRENTKDNSISSIRVSSDKIDGLMNLVSELVTMQAQLSLFAEQNFLPELTSISENMDKISRRLRDTAFSICLIPLDNMLTRFQRLVRDVSTELNKNVTFLTEGTETELDKTMIESLADPIMHILRNSLDHGIESAAERKRKGKFEQGTILLKAFYSGTNVHIQISDDGAGIDVEKIRVKAIQKELIAADAVLSKQELLELIFFSGLSTAEKVSELSGRGVGMDVVKRKITEIRGEVEIASEVNKGTTITIKLPLTLSIIDGLLVKIEDTLFVVPLSSVDTIFAAKYSELNEYNHLVIHAGKQIPYVYLRKMFHYSVNTDTQEQVIVVNYMDTSVGIVVDRVVGEYQAVLKPLGKSFKNLDIISGATILGDGTIALVLDTTKIIKQFINAELNQNKQISL